MSAGASLSAGPAPLLSTPGLAGFFSACGIGSFISASRRRREGVGARWVDHVPDPAGELARVTRANGIELRRHAVARAHLHLAVGHPGLEAIEGANRWAADDLPLEVVDATVTGADEVLGGRDVVHGTTQVRATGR